MSSVSDIPGSTIFGNWTALAFLMVLALAIAAGNVLLPEDGSEPTAVTGQSGLTPGSILLPGGAEEVQAAVRNLEADTREHRKEQRRLRLVNRFRPLPSGVTMERLEEIAECESGGDPKVVSSTGLYHGKYQFHPDTWESVGGRGLPSRAPEVEQDYRAALLLARSGPGQWPVCGA